MGLTYATESWVLAILHWCEVAIEQTMWDSLLPSVIVYAFLLQTTIHLLVTSFWPDDREPRRAYFASVLALVCFALGCILDTIPTPMIGAEPFSPPREGVPKCCANSDVAHMFQVLFFYDAIYFAVSAGVLCGALLVHFLVAGAGMYDHERRTGWPGVGWGNALGALLCARMAIIFNGSAGTICPDGSFYLQLFSQPLMALAPVIGTYGGLGLVLIFIDGLCLPVLWWRVFRALNLLWNCGLFIMCGQILGTRGMFTPQFLVSCIVCVLVAVQGLVWSLIHPVARRGRDRAPLQPPNSIQIEPPTAPPQPAPAPIKTSARYYVPTHVVTGLDKKGF